MMQRRQALDGSLPSRIDRTKRPLELPADTAFEELRAGSGKQAASTTTSFTRLLRNLCRAPKFAPRVVPIIPDETRTFGMDSLFKEFAIYASQAQRYEPVHQPLLLTYKESQSGQIRAEGIERKNTRQDSSQLGASLKTSSYL